MRSSAWRRVGDNAQSMLATYHTEIGTQFLTLTPEERARHTFVIGLTGNGKSVLLHNMAASDIHDGHGIMFLDPHGTECDDLIAEIPKRRLSDLVYVDPFDPEYAIGFNPFFEPGDPYLAAINTTEAIRSVFSASWGPRLDYFLRNQIALLMENPGTTLADVPRLCHVVPTKKSRQSVEELTGFTTTNPEVRRFWEHDVPSYDKKYLAEAQGPILNKVSAWLGSEPLRRMLLQRRPKFTIRDALESNKIVVVNLSKAVLGEEPARLLGSLLISQIKTAMYGRNSMTPFDLYVDEARNFNTTALESITAEARKFGVTLTAAIQWLSQLPPEMQDAMLSVRTIIAFNVLGADSERLAKEMPPLIPPQLSDQPPFKAHLKRGFMNRQHHVTTLPKLPPAVHFMDEAKQRSRSSYGRRL